MSKSHSPSRDDSPPRSTPRMEKTKALLTEMIGGGYLDKTEKMIIASLDQYMPLLDLPRAIKVLGANYEKIRIVLELPMPKPHPQPHPYLTKFLTVVYMDNLLWESSEHTINLSLLPPNFGEMRTAVEDLAVPLVEMATSLNRWIIDGYDAISAHPDGDRFLEKMGLPTKTQLAAEESKTDVA